MGVNKNEVKQKPAEIRRPYFGGADGTQTHDLYDANVALYQLSYNPKTMVRIRRLELPRHCCH